MKIAHIHAFSRNGEKLDFYINFLKVEEEHEDSYIVQDSDKGIEPRSNWLSKEIDLEAADDGYASLNLPGWVDVSPYETSGIIYVLETEIAKGKEILKKTFIDVINKKIESFEKTKKSIVESE